MATMIRLMQPNDLSSSSSSILCLLPIEPVCLPLATDNKPFKAHPFGVYPLAELFSDVLLRLFRPYIFQKGASSKCGSAEVKSEIHNRVKLGLRLAYSEIVDIVFARQQVAFEQRNSLCLGDGLPLLYSFCVTDTDSPHSCGAFVCGQLAALKLDNLVE